MTKEFEGVIAWGIMTVVTLLTAIVTLLIIDITMRMIGTIDSINYMFVGGSCLFIMIITTLLFIMTGIACFKRIKYLDEGIEKSIF
ncbi:MAG: hypothetical protein WCP14_00190 [bacterium]